MPAQLTTLITFGAILPIVFGIGITVIVLVWVRKFMRTMTGANLKDGTPAQATILRIWDTGITVNEDPVIGMDVQVYPEDGEPWRATIPKSLISRLDIPRIQPGQIVPVRFDPQNPQRVALDMYGYK